MLLKSLNTYEEKKEYKRTNYIYIYKNVMLFISK